jgi:Tol biopolymer transport system component
VTAARIASLAGLFALGVVLAPATPAAADFGPIQLVSKSATEQAEEAVAPALSADGRYLAFQGTIGGLKGVFRKDLQTGAVLPVAVGGAYEEGLAADASAPSISADGRYVSFTTEAPLDPVDDTQPDSSDVYVADMDSSPPTYELASALDGSSQGLTYEGSGGSVASGRVALSADGRRVVFVTTAKSNLGGTAGGTPAGQVVLRDLDTRETTLVSVQRNSGTGEMEPGVPVPGGAVMEDPVLPLLSGAALSADGTTVAWLGTHLPAQVPLLSDEEKTISQFDSNGSFPYDEPLWRRVADGPGAPTRRIVGDGDPSAPGCPPDGTLAEPACQGPFPGITDKNGELNSATGWLGPSKIDGVPQLSADGRTVALIGNPTEATNVFLVDMSEGLDRRQAVRQLTRQASVNPADEAATVNREPYVPLNGHIYDLAISPDGRRIAFATARQRFPLAPPDLIGSPPAQLGLVELYLIDLEGETLQRVTHGDGGLSEASLASTGSGLDGDGATAPSFGDEGRLISFASTASNLVEGDANDASDAFVVEDDEAPRTGGTVSISPPPPEVIPKRRWQLTLGAYSMPDGSVRLVAEVPGAGALRARVGTTLGVDSRPQRLALARARATASGPVELTLAPPRRYRRLVHSREGLYATARVSFSSPTGKPLHCRLQIHFHAHQPKRGGKR